MYKLSKYNLFFQGRLKKNYFEKYKKKFWINLINRFIRF